jgi:phosphatidylglycerol:prolipoprotein diacylglycerol transferase
MFQIEIGIDPIIAQVGPLALRWYSVAVMVAIVIAVVVTRRELIRRGIALRNFDTVVIWTVIGGILGARLFHVIDNFERFMNSPVKILAFWEGGLAIYGAVVGGFAALAIMSRIYSYPFRQVIDAIAPGLVLGQAFGRIGCITNGGDAWGAPTSWPFAFIYTNPDATMIPRELLGVPTHPYAAYDMAVNLAVFAVIWPLRKRALPPGTIFAVFALLYAIGRFVISFVRQEQVWFWGLQEAQVIALVALMVSLVALTWLLYRDQMKVELTARA